MFKNYKGLWAILAVAFVIFAVVSAFEAPLTIGGVELKSSKIAETLTGDRADDNKASGKTAAVDSVAVDSAKQQISFPVPLDTASKKILIIGDSMLDGLSPRMAAYAKQNGHTLYSVRWYSSGIECWAKSGKFAKYMNEFKPDFVFISLGGNLLFVKDVKEKNQKYLDQILALLGDTPYVWIGPPNWKPDTGINDMLAESLRPGSFFLSNGMHFERRSDGAHPTMASAAQWLDSVARWMPEHSMHPIKMEVPSEENRKALPAKTILHQPSEIE